MAKSFGARDFRKCLRRLLKDPTGSLSSNPATKPHAAPPPWGGTLPPNESTSCLQGRTSILSNVSDTIRQSPLAYPCPPRSGCGTFPHAAGLSVPISRSMADQEGASLGLAGMRRLSRRTEAGREGGAAGGTSGEEQRARSGLTRKRLMGAAALGSALGLGALISTQEPGEISKWSFWAADLGTPLLHLLDPETAHELAILCAQLGLLPREHRADPASLHCTVWGRQLSNPVGLAAGWDKDAKAIEGVLGLGFGFTEIGSVTPLPQSGNPRPRVFRLREQKAVINRYGFNSEGIAEVAGRLGMFYGKRRAAEPPAKLDADEGGSPSFSPFLGLLGVNLGKNKWTEDAASDYVAGVYTLSQYADFLVINVSSPNTPGLRKLQGRKQLQELVKKVIKAREEMQWGEKGPPPLLVKVAPDLSDQDMADIAAVALSLKLDGLIIGNTTVSRPDSVLGLLHSEESGGLSGQPLKDLSTHVLRQMYALTRGRITLVGCGGVFSGEDAYEKIRAGASLVQLYTGLIYEGPGLVPRVKMELAKCLDRDGFKTVQDAVGADHR